LFEASRAPALLTPVFPWVESREPGAGGAIPGACAANSSASRLATGRPSSVSLSKTAPTALLPMRSVVASRLDHDLLGVVARLQHDVDFSAGRGLDVNLLDDFGLEAAPDRGQRVGARGQPHQPDGAVVDGDARALQPGLRAGDGDEHAGHGRAGRIARLDQQGRPGRLRVRRGRAARRGD
jgi:hypothetical protein